MIPAKIITLTEQLQPMMPDQFARQVLEGSLRVAWDTANPIRLNLFAAGVRELVSYILHHAAPDEEVRLCSWFAEDLNVRARREAEGRSKDAGITRRQRMIYATQGGLPDTLLAELHTDVQGTHGALAKVYDRLNGLTHVRPGTLIANADEITAFMEAALQALLAFYGALDECRTIISDAVAEVVSVEAEDQLTSTVVAELDELSTHTRVDEVEIDQVIVKTITATEVSLEARGTVYVELVYGSQSDRDHDMGASMYDHYPFQLSLTTSTQNLHRVHAGAVKVDNSSFYE